MPEKIIHVMNIAGEAEKGARLLLSGTVYHTDGKTPFEGVILYAYQTDQTGHYSKTGDEKGIQKWHGRLHGWCKTDASGKYEIRTIRPAPYPGNTNPAHIHAVIKEPGGKEPYYIKDFVFADDTLVSDQYLSREYGKGTSGLVELKKLNDKSWFGQRDLILTGN
jgi:protocatechuate 3,4-dioxygenase beta subunit